MAKLTSVGGRVHMPFFDTVAKQADPTPTLEMLLVRLYGVETANAIYTDPERLERARMFLVMGGYKWREWSE